MTKIINLVGGPCCGKSTTAAGLFADFKLNTSKSVELVTEVIKDYVYDENRQAINDQLLITATQNHNLKRLDGKVDFIISDASLLNGIVYNEFYNSQDPVLDDLALTLFQKYDNVVFLLPRKPKYDQYGRTQTELQAQHIDELFISILTALNINYYDMRGCYHKNLPSEIMEIIKNDI